MKVLVVLVFIFLSGCNGGHYEPPSQRQVEMAQDAYWQYVQQSTSTPEDYVRDIRHSPPGQYLCSLISKSIDLIYNFYHNVYTHIVRWTNNFYNSVRYEIDHLKQDLEHFLLYLEADVHHHAKELAAQTRSKLEGLKESAVHYIEALDPKGFKIALQEKIQDLHEHVDKCFEHLDNTHHHHHPHDHYDHHHSHPHHRDHHHLLYKLFGYSHYDHPHDHKNHHDDKNHHDHHHDLKDHHHHDHKDHHDDKNHHDYHQLLYKLFGYSHYDHHHDRKDHHHHDHKDHHRHDHKDHHHHDHKDHHDDKNHHDHHHDHKDHQHHDHKDCHDHHHDHKDHHDHHHDHKDHQHHDHKDHHDDKDHHDYHQLLYKLFGYSHYDHHHDHKDHHDDKDHHDHKDHHHHGHKDHHHQDLKDHHHHDHKDHHHHDHHLKMKVYESLERFKVTLSSLAYGFEVKLTRTTNKLNKEIVPHRRRGLFKLRKDSDNLQKELGSLWEEWAQSQKKAD